MTTSATETSTLDGNEAVASVAYRLSEVKGARQNASSYMTFEVASEQQEDVGSFLNEVKTLVHDVGLVYVSEQRL